MHTPTPKLLNTHTEEDTKKKDGVEEVEGGRNRERRGELND